MIMFEAKYSSANLDIRNAWSLNGGMGMLRAVDDSERRAASIRILRGACGGHHFATTPVMLDPAVRIHN